MIFASNFGATLERVRGWQGERLWVVGVIPLFGLVFLDFVVQFFYRHIFIQISLPNGIIKGFCPHSIAFNKRVTYHVKIPLQISQDLLKSRYTFIFLRKDSKFYGTVKLCGVALIELGVLRKLFISKLIGKKNRSSGRTVSSYFDNIDL